MPRQAARSAASEARARAYNDITRRQLTCEIVRGLYKEAHTRSSARADPFAIESKQVGPLEPLVQYPLANPFSSTGEANPKLVLVAEIK